MRPELQFLQDWWHFIVFAMTGVTAWVLGRERQRWRINELGNKFTDLQRRVEHLERQGTDAGLHLVEIQTTQKAILAGLEEIKRDLRGKVDK